MRGLHSQHFLFIECFAAHAYFHPKPGLDGHTAPNILWAFKQGTIVYLLLASHQPKILFDKTPAQKQGTGNDEDIQNYAACEASPLIHGLLTREKGPKVRMILEFATGIAGTGTKNPC